MRKVESIKEDPRSTLALYGEWGKKHLDLIWKFHAATVKREQNSDSKEAKIEFHEAFLELDEHLRNHVAEEKSSTACLEWLDKNRDMVISFPPSGDWSMFSLDTKFVKGAPRSTCYGRTPKDLLERAMKYNFPSEEGYLQMIKDGNELKQVKSPA